MEEIYAPLEPPRKAGVWPEKALNMSPNTSIRCVLSIDSDSASSLGSTSRSISKQYDDEEQEAASVDPLEKPLLDKLSELPKKQPKSSQPVCIYRVPASFREKKKVLYEPRMVSIGPYYHGSDKLQAMEEHKLRCLRDFISRTPKVRLSMYLQEIRKLESQARQCYSENFKLSTEQFVQMLLLDGCFILEYFLKYEEKEFDAHCDVGWGGPTIVADLLLLENQIPFFIVHKLASFLPDLKDFQNCNGRCNLIDKLFTLVPYQGIITKPDVSCKSIQHLLHLYYNFVIPNEYVDLPRPYNVLKHSISWVWMRINSQQEGEEGKPYQKPSVIIPCAAELHDCGVKFRRNKSPYLFDIKFEKGILEMPLLVVDNTIRTIFTNMVAFEQTQFDKIRIFTSYVVLWNMLVDTAKDVSLLEHQGILELVQHNEDQAANFFNELADCWSLDYSHHHYNDLFTELQKHCSSIWHKSRARLMQDYFHNPWSSISVVVGMMLIMLTVIQTIYTVWPAGGQ